MRNDILTWAETTLNAASGCEVSLRAATSRAYYSVYHGCESLSKMPNMQIILGANGGSHEALYSGLKTLSASRCNPKVDLLNVRKIGIMASSILKPYRVHADYHLGKYQGKDFSHAKASDCIAKAKLLNNMIDVELAK